MYYITWILYFPQKLKILQILLVNENAHKWRNSFSTAVKNPRAKFLEFFIANGHEWYTSREQLDPTEKIVFQAIQMALIAVLSEVQQQQQKLFIKFWAKSPC